MPAERRQLHPDVGEVAGSFLGDARATSLRGQAYSSCQGVRMRGPSWVTATVNSKWAASEPSAE
jgi:hypothetical protein